MGRERVLGHGRVRRLSLGIARGVAHLPRRLVRELDLLGDQAVEIIEPTPGGPAKAPQLRPAT